MPKGQAPRAKGSITNIGGADFYNAKNPLSSAQPQGGNTDYGRANMTVDNEPARQSRLGNNTSPSGPKPISDAPFFKHTVKDNL